MRRILALFIAAVVALAACCPALAEEGKTLPQIDNSTARIPITDAIYKHFTEQGYTGPEPLCSKTHGAWLNLADGSADIIFLIAPTESELEALAEAGVDVEMKVFGYDGLVFLGNASNPVEGLSSAQIRAIYSGKIKNWKEIEGGSDADIAVYIRDAESGSQRLFESLVWTGYDMPDFGSMQFIEGEVQPTVGQVAMEYDDMGEITFNVMRERYSIGFNIMSYIDSEFLGEDSDSDEETIFTTDDVHLRSGPGLDYDSLGTLRSGTVLKRLHETSEDDRGVYWYKVEDPGLGAGWVSSRYAEYGWFSNALKLFRVDGFEPNTENFASGNYPFVTTSYVVIRANEPQGSPARELFDWIGSDESRSIIEENSTLSVAFSEPVVIRTRESRLDTTQLEELMECVAQTELIRDDLYPFTEEELTYLWQAVYASAGLKFHSQRYSDYFAGFDWYEPLESDYAAVAANFSDTQRANLELIGSYLEELRRAAVAWAPRTLAYAEGESNMNGDDVREVQSALAEWGYLDADGCDGIFGPGTAEAVKAFQSANGISPTGCVDRVTRMMLL